MSEHTPETRLEKGLGRIASVEFTLNGKKMKHQFRVLKKTGSDKMGLGIPWLREERKPND